MTKEIFLIRHASAEEPGNSSMLRDFDRDLTSRGIMESARMGNFLHSKNFKFDGFLSSPAVRAKETAKIISEQLKMDSEAVRIEESLYGGGAGAYLTLINALTEDLTTVAILGHNPDISFFADYLSSTDCGGEMEKATVIVLKFDDLKWEEISGKSGHFKERFTLESIK
jgi:phosphohistidine phosphatase